MSDNPFAAPETELGAAAPDAPEHYGDASQGQRLGNLLIDYVATLLMSMVFGVFVALVFGPRALEGLASQAFGIFNMIFYYVLLEGLSGRTVGKLITGTKVIDYDTGLKPSLWRILGRTLARFVPFEAFSFLGADASGWHDSWSHTRVVRLRPSKLERTAEEL